MCICWVRGVLPDEQSPGRVKSCSRGYRRFGPRPRPASRPRTRPDEQATSRGVEMAINASVPSPMPGRDLAGNVEHFAVDVSVTANAARLHLRGELDLRCRAVAARTLREQRRHQQEVGGVRPRANCRFVIPVASPRCSKQPRDAPHNAPHKAARCASSTLRASGPSRHRNHRYRRIPQPRPPTPGSKTKSLDESYARRTK